MLPTVQIGPAALQFPAFLSLIGFWLGITQIEKTSDLFGIRGNVIFRLMILSTLAGILGARLAYILRYWGVFIESPISILSLNIQLLDGESGLLIGTLVFIILGQKTRLSLWQSLDTMTIGLAIFMAFHALANFASGDGYGSPTYLPWGIPLWGERRHPVQLYDFILAVGIMLIVRPGWKAAVWVRQDERRSGAIFLIFIVLSSLARLFTEAFRGDSLFLWNSIRAGQVMAFLILTIGLIILRNRITVPK